MRNYPPKWADAFLVWMCNADVLEEIQGDLYELYHYRHRQYGQGYADVRFVWEVLRIIRFPLIKHPFVKNQRTSVIINTKGFNTVSHINTAGQPAWNDMLFEWRNKEYGAYRIRKEYGGNMLFGFTLVLSLWIILILWWLIKF